MISRAIDSVYAQTFTDWEIVVVDDGSTDNIKEVIADLDNPSVRLITQANQGAAAARNLGIDLARGCYVAFLDSDDAFLPHHLQDIHTVIQAHGKVAVYCPVRVQRDTGYIVKPPRAIAQDESMADYLMCDRGFVQTSGLALSAEAARRVRYRPDVSFGDDTDFAIRLQLAGHRFVMTERPGVDWFDEARDDRLSEVPVLASADLPWLQALKPSISKSAYHGYRGWHVAKGLIAHHPWQAIKLYLIALLARSFGPRMAMVVLAQILMPRKTYRRLADLTIFIVSHKRNWAPFHRL